MAVFELMHLEKSRSHRISWLLEELGQSYSVSHFKRNPVTMLAPEDFKKAHPLGKSPILIIDGEAYVESGAIIEAVLETVSSDVSKALSADINGNKKLYRQFLHYAEGSIGSLLLLSVLLSEIRGKLPFFLSPVFAPFKIAIEKGFLDAQIKTHFSFIEDHLNSHLWFAGDEFTAADIQMSYPLFVVKVYLGLTGYPKIQEFLDRCEKRAAFQQAVSKVGLPI
jgi:glutathione S-transferase